MVSRSLHTRVSRSRVSHTSHWTNGNAHGDDSRPPNLPEPVVGPAASAIGPNVLLAPRQTAQVTAHAAQRGDRVHAATPPSACILHPLRWGVECFERHARVRHTGRISVRGRCWRATMRSVRAPAAPERGTCWTTLCHHLPVGGGDTGWPGEARNRRTATNAAAISQQQRTTSHARARAAADAGAPHGAPCLTNHAACLTTHAAERPFLANHPRPRVAVGARVTARGTHRRPSCRPSRRRRPSCPRPPQPRRRCPALHSLQQRPRRPRNARRPSRRHWPRRLRCHHRSARHRRPRALHRPRRGSPPPDPPRPRESSARTTLSPPRAAAPRSARASRARRSAARPPPPPAQQKTRGQVGPGPWRAHAGGARNQKARATGRPGESGRRGASSKPAMHCLVAAFAAARAPAGA
eukprot:4163738-Prymnesium_polylepis.1